MIEFAHLVYLVFVPFVIAGLGIAVVWRYVDRGPLRTALQTIAAILFFVPQPFALFLGAYSAGLRAYQQVLLAAWGLGTGALIVTRLQFGSALAAERPGVLTRAARWRQSADEIRRTEYVVTAIRERGSPERRPNRFVLGVAAIAMIALGIYCGWNAVGDYLLAHDSVAGTVEGARVIRNTRSPRTYQVMINGRTYNITLDLLAKMNRGDYIEADVGVASRTIVAVRRVAHSFSTGSPR